MFATKVTRTTVRPRDLVGIFFDDDAYPYCFLWCDPQGNLKFCTWRDARMSTNEDVFGKGEHNHWFDCQDDMGITVMPIAEADTPEEATKKLKVFSCLF